jgi:hypothetical protein
MKEFILIEYQANLSKYNIIDFLFNVETLKDAEKEFLKRFKNLNMKKSINLYYIAEVKKIIC